MNPSTASVRVAEPSDRDKKAELGRENEAVYVLFEAHYVSNETADHCSLSGLEQFKESGVMLSGYESIKTFGYASANNVLDYHSHMLTAIS